MENYMICNCKSVSYFDVEDALHQAKSLSDLEKTFEEVQKIDSTGHCVYQGKEGTLPATTPVSMNLWGLTTDIFDILEEEYAKFLKTADLMKDEFYIPLVIGDAVKNGKATVKAYINKDVWHGITYREDLPEVKEAIAGYVKAGLYEGL